MKPQTCCSPEQFSDDDATITGSRLTTLASFEVHAVPLQHGMAVTVGAQWRFTTAKSTLRQIVTYGPTI